MSRGRTLYTSADLSVLRGTGDHDLNQSQSKSGSKEEDQLDLVANDLEQKISRLSTTMEHLEGSFFFGGDETLLGEG